MARKFGYDLYKEAKGSVPDELKGMIIDISIMSDIDSQVSAYINETINATEVISSLRSYVDPDKDYASLGANYVFGDGNGVDKNIENLSLSDILKLRNPEEKYNEDGEPLPNREQVIIDSATALMDRINKKKDADKTANEKALLEAMNFYVALAAIRTFQNKIELRFKESVDSHMGEPENMTKEDAMTAAREDVSPFLPTTVLYFQELHNSVLKLKELSGDRVRAPEARADAAPESSPSASHRDRHRAHNSRPVHRLERALQMITEALTLLLHALSHAPVVPIMGSAYGMNFSNVTRTR